MIIAHDLEVAKGTGTKGNSLKEKSDKLDYTKFKTFSLWVNTIKEVYE